MSTALLSVLACPLVVVGCFMDVAANLFVERLLDIFDPSGDHC